MGILHIAIGLSESSTLWMRRQLEMIGDEVAYIFTDDLGAKKYRSQYKCVVIWRSKITSLNRLFHYLNLLKVLKAIYSKKVDVVFIHYATTAVLFRKVLNTTRKPVFVHCHGYDVTWDGKSSGVRMHGKYYVDHVRSLPSNVTFIANSKKTIQRLVDIGISADRIVLKYLGVDVPEVFPARTNENDFLTVLYLGRLIDFKGPDLVIKAFEKACSNGFNGILNMAGDGPLRSTCELLRANSPYKDRINLLGAVDEKTGKKLRRNADIFTAHNCTGPLSGQEEAFGVTMAEAMAEGIPIINASNGSIPELLKDDYSAVLVNPGDIDGHAKALLKYQQEPEYRYKLARNAWKDARDKFSLEQESRRLREILHLPLREAL